MQGAKEGLGQELATLLFLINKKKLEVLQFMKTKTNPKA